LPWVDHILPVVTNIVIVRLKEGIKAHEQVADLKAKGIRCAPFGPQYIRFVTHLNFDDEALAAFEQKINQ
jgi:threonine aldolase